MTDLPSEPTMSVTALNSDLPVPQQRIRRPAPIVAKRLAFAKRQVVNHAAREVVSEVDLRVSQIRPAYIRQGIIVGAKVTAEAIGEPVVQGLRVGIAQQCV